MRLAVAFVLAGISTTCCNGPRTDPAVATATTETVPSKSAPSPTPAPAPVAPATFPPIDVSCASDADCTTTSQFAACCGGCELRYSSKAFVARVTAYCAAQPPVDCLPQACSWAMALPKCTAGKCQATK